MPHATVAAVIFLNFQSNELSKLWKAHLKILQVHIHNSTTAITIFLDALNVDLRDRFASVRVYVSVHVWDDSSFLLKLIIHRIFFHVYLLVVTSSPWMLQLLAN